MLNLDCVPISTYCKETGETPEAINKRVQRGVWREGVQVLKVEGVKERWIDLSEVANGPDKTAQTTARRNNQETPPGRNDQYNFHLQRS